ncbi:Golgi apyrase [Tilletia horrida]|uniref:Golgi apyrase n=1 Tax=Tilletia horrida TaxID=155126 RepID=A0AAN6G994_9BASI|nr:Golgi apyrase [Tilletia horrida]KAK0527990.1 Golgi apyrase [Tilletia horrida]KAK0533783.1 Golgi apyrase [Tilletia horrida]KAK0562577.1 Golgi apyrase [Tilletia horrida]
MKRNAQREPAPSPADWSKNRKYAVIVDAGSSGSRMQVYSWVDPASERADRLRTGKTLKELPKVEKGTWSGAGKDWQLKVEPGISSFATHTQDLPEYLGQLFAHAVDVIPHPMLSSTPVYLLATAGMRLLTDAQQHDILTTTCNFIKTRTPFKIGDAQCTDHVKVITGEEEGMLGWIAINYLMDGFKYKPDDPLKHEVGLPTGTHGRTTYGFLDMGGASMQIAFEPSEVQPADDNIFPIKLRMLDGTDVVHNVFSVTFLGYGANQAREQYMDMLLQHNSQSASHASSSVASSPTLPDPCLPPGLTLSGPAHPDKGISNSSFTGTGSFPNCMTTMSPLLDKEAACSKPPCLFHGVHVPKIDFSVNHFIGVSEYWYSSNDVFNLGGAYDFPKFQKAAQEFCATPWSTLLESLQGGKLWGKQVTEDRLQKQCFKSAWLATVLHDGIGLPRIADEGGKGDGKPHADTAQDKADQKNLFQSINDVEGLSVSWTLGKAVLESSQDVQPSTTTDKSWPGIGKGAAPNANTTRGQATYAIFGLLVLFLIYFCWSRSRRSRVPSATSSIGSPRSTGGGGGSLLDRVAHALRGIISLKDAQSSRGDYMLANMEEGADVEGDEDEDSNGKLTPRNNGGINGVVSAGFGLGLGGPPSRPPSRPSSRAASWGTGGAGNGLSLSRPPSRGAGTAAVGIASSVWPQPLSLSRPPSRGPSPGLTPWAAPLASPGPYAAMTSSWHASTNSGGSSSGAGGGLGGGLTSPTSTDGRRQSGGSLPRMSLSSAAGGAGTATVAAVASSSMSRVNSFTSLSTQASGALTPRAGARRAAEFWNGGSTTGSGGTLLDT